MGLRTAGWWWVGLWVVWSGQFGMVSMDYTASNLQTGPQSQPSICGLSTPGLVCNPAGVFNSNQVSDVQSAITTVQTGTNAGCAGNSDGIRPAVAAVDKISGSDGLDSAQLKTKADAFAADLRKNWNIKSGGCQNDIILVYSAFGPTIGWSAGSNVLKKVSYSQMDNMVRKAITKVTANPNSASAVLASTLNNLEESSNGASSKTQIFLYSLGGVLGAIGLILIALLICACCRSCRNQDGADLEKAEDEESIVSGSDTSTTSRKCCYCCKNEDDAAEEVVAWEESTTQIIIPQWASPDPKPEPAAPDEEEEDEEEGGEEEEQEEEDEDEEEEEEEEPEQEETRPKKVQFVGDKNEEESEEEVEEEEEEEVEEEEEDEEKEEEEEEVEEGEEPDPEPEPEPEPESESDSELEPEPERVPVPMPVPVPVPEPGCTAFTIKIGEDGMAPGDVVTVERNASPEVITLCLDSEPEVPTVEPLTPDPPSPTVVVPPFTVSVIQVGLALRQGNPMYQPQAIAHPGISPNLVPAPYQPALVHTYTPVTSPHTTYTPISTPLLETTNQQYDNTPTVTVKNNFGKSTVLIDIPEEEPLQPVQASQWPSSNSSSETPVFLSSTEQPVPQDRPVFSQTVVTTTFCPPPVTNHHPQPQPQHTTHNFVICPASKDASQNTVPEEEPQSPDDEPKREKSCTLKPVATGSTTKVKIKCKSKKKKKSKKSKKSSSESESDSEEEFKKKKRKTSKRSCSDSSSESDEKSGTWKKSSSGSDSESDSESEESDDSSKSTASSKSDSSKSEKSSEASAESKSYGSEESKSSSASEEDEQVSSIASVPRPPTPPISRSRSSKTSRKTKPQEYVRAEYVKPEYVKPGKKRKPREDIIVDNVTQMTATPTMAKKWSSQGGISNKNKDIAYF